MNEGETSMTKQKTPHTQTQQDTTPEQTDLDNDQRGFEAEADDQIYENMEGAETGEERSPRKLHTGGPQHRTEPEQVAHEGSVHTRTPKRPSQGITAHSAEEESARQEKVVNARPDAKAGVNHSK
jgi:hypothetical protein